MEEMIGGVLQGWKFWDFPRMPHTSWRY